MRFIMFFILYCLIHVSLSADVLQTYNNNVLRDARIGMNEARLHAIATCGIKRMSSCVRILIDNLDDYRLSVREDSALSLGLLGYSEAIEDIQKLVQNTGIIIQEHQKMVNASESQLLSYLRKEFADSDSIYAKNFMIRYKEKINKELTKYLKAQGTMLRALGFIKSKSIAPYLHQYLQDKSSIIRYNAALALGIQRDPVSVKVLESSLLNEKIAKVQISLVSSLLAFNRFDQKLIQKLIPLLGSDDYKVRLLASQAVRRFRIREAHKAVQRAIKLENNFTVKRSLQKTHSVILLF